MLSERGRTKAGQPLRSDLELFERASKNAYGPENTDGCITLCIAENLLQWERIRDRFRRIAATHPWPDWVAAYAPLPGHPDFLEAVASFVTRHIAGRALDAHCFCASAGATSVVEISALCLAEKDAYAVFPAPAYQAYTPDIESKAGVNRYDITDYAPEDFNGDYHPLGIDQLDAAHAELGDRFRMLVVTQPDNPTGAIYSARQLRDFADWCEDRRIHLIVNEIYALSQFDRGREGIDNEAVYTSFLPLIEKRDSPYLHWWYSFSKDFGISGMRVGLLYSRNDEFREAYANFNAPHQVSTITQWLLSELLYDHRWVSDFQRANQQLLTDAYLSVTKVLDELDIPYTPARGSLFVWADFSRYLGDDPDADEAFWREVFDRTGVLLTAPEGMGALRPGWLRIVYSCVPSEALREAMERLRGYLS